MYGLQKSSYESRIFCIGFARINEFTHVTKDFVIFGINKDQVITTESIKIKYTGADKIFAGFLPTLMFLIRYIILYNKIFISIFSSINILGIMLYNFFYIYENPKYRE